MPEIDMSAELEKENVAEERRQSRESGRSGKAVFVESWTEYIDALGRLGWSCDKEDFERVKGCIATLKGVVDRAAEKVKE